MLRGSKEGGGGGGDEGQDIWDVIELCGPEGGLTRCMVEWVGRIVLRGRTRMDECEPLNHGVDRPNLEVKEFIWDGSRYE